MRAVAYVWMFDEEDVIGHVVRHLLTQGVDVHIFDNWSSDFSSVVARDAADKLHRHIEIERWPLEQPTTVAWADMLRHTEEVALAHANKHGAFWALHHDADEFRSAPYDKTLRDFLWRVQMVGWNAVDHHVLVYAPVDGYDGTLHDPQSYFSTPLADHIDQRNGQRKVWVQRPDQRVDLASSGGHDVRFPGRLVCPEKLILKHYPMRGERQREAKARSRAARWDQRERAMGWHAQYA